jgi:hypothetical protein
MKRIFAALLAASVVPACTPPVAPENYEITVFPSFDGGAVAELENIPPDCYVACENLARPDIDCPEAKPAGRTCPSVCAAAELAGFSLRPRCVAAAGSVLAVRACGTVRCRGR